MTSSEFKINSPLDVATWFKYLSATSEREFQMRFKDVGAIVHYRKNKLVYDNIYRCLANEGLDIKEFVTAYFKQPGYHSPSGLEKLTENRCSDFFKSVRRYFEKTVLNISNAMKRKNMETSLSVLNNLCETGMLAPNFLAGKISAYWLAGVPEISEKIKNAKGLKQSGKTVSGGSSPFHHGDDLLFTFDRFLNQKDVYYHILCRAFNRMDRGVNSLDVTDRWYGKNMKG